MTIAESVRGLRVARDTLTNPLRVDGPLLDDGGDIGHYQVGWRKTFVLRHPDHVDHVLHGAVDHYEKSMEYETLRAVVGLSLFTDEGASWRRHRMLINPVLAKRHLESLFELMLVPVEAFVARLDDGEIEMTEAMTELTLDVVGAALFGRGMADLAHQIGPTVGSGLRGAERATRLLAVARPPLWLVRGYVEAVRRSPWLPPRLARMQAVMRTIDATVWDVIEERRPDPGRADDLLGLLLSVRDEHGDTLPLKRVRDEAATFMLAGHETTANALSWMWYLLARNPDARERLLAEVDDVLGERRPEFADIARLPWTTACLMEAMRIFPPAWAIPRRCVRDDVIDGHRIPKGAQVVIPIHAIHHDPRLWPEPETFDPTRFLGANARSHPRSAYLPFGGGRRVCAGQSFAVIESVLVAALMSRSHTFDLAPHSVIEPEATLTLRPRHGMPMIATPRHAA